jgi:hypothetical protein
LHLWWCSSSTESRLPGWKPNVWPLLVVPVNYLVEGIILWSRTFYSVKTQDFRSDDDNACVLFLFGGVAFGESIMWSGCCHLWLFECLITAMGSLFFCFSFFFAGCVMS